MSDQFHTRGPWETRGPTRVYGNLQRDQNGTADLVASTVRASDATLIAAAPEMLKALKAQEELAALRFPGDPMEAIAKVRAMRRAAISKAEGEG